MKSSNALVRSSQSFNQLFPVWAIGLGALGFYFPQTFTPMAPGISWMLSLIMFTMGLTLAPEDFKRVLREPKAIGVGVVLQFTVMPLAALLAAKTFGLDQALTTGMVLVGATAGGTASNVICWLAGGRVALSVSMTLTSTILSVVLTPLLTWLLLKSSVDINIAGMFLSIAKIVVAPIALGVVVHSLLKQWINRLEPLLASTAVIIIALIIAIVVALNAGRLSSVGGWVLAAVVLHNALGLTAGYGLARALKFDQATSRTIAIEVGMQNSGLAVALAQQFFTAAAALPGALFSVWHNVSGSLLASWWRRKG
ncbi:bile acid:sodium symporter family protein [Gilvimarinus sp. SDUM040013]|uniref:Bile acid:sodium symporter family protein n=1 Tax=Gilvimarinus gilvus TaxID=3058038 RepID=A0ABU4RVQ1_9GAMM|nr:bile acid:sodium symporter family protein [Gilvimarinus sp. SDUM040013]MDO3386833.1 bile acid:sodium symporter family protein [Gilvimarinus sp. SDUM040013]MDX6848237.1 bile acid:sodium symporter family protein [Gilvimarinus sp. SDUM040013]